MEVIDKPLKTTQILIRATGILFLLLAVTEFIVFVTGFAFSNLSFVVLAVIGVGMFEKHAWSRILGILLSIWMVLQSSAFLFVYFFPQNGFLHLTFSVRSNFALLSTLFYLVFYAFTGYVLLRADVRKLFDPNFHKESKHQ